MPRSAWPLKEEDADDSRCCQSCRPSVSDMRKRRSIHTRVSCSSQQIPSLGLTPSMSLAWSRFMPESKEPRKPLIYSLLPRKLSCMVSHAPATGFWMRIWAVCLTVLQGHAAG